MLKFWFISREDLVGLVKGLWLFWYKGIIKRNVILVEIKVLGELFVFKKEKYNNNNKKIISFINLLFGD